MIETEFLNRVELRGRVGHDPRITTVGDSQVARFSLATNEAFRGKNVMDFNDVHKGTFVSLTGRLRSTRFTGSDGVERSVFEIVANRLEPFVPAVRE